MFARAMGAKLARPLKEIKEVPVSDCLGHYRGALCTYCNLGLTTCLGIRMALLRWLAACEAAAHRQAAQSALPVPPKARLRALLAAPCEFEWRPRSGGVRVRPRMGRRFWAVQNPPGALARYLDG